MNARRLADALLGALPWVGLAAVVAFGVWFGGWLRDGGAVAPLEAELAEARSALAETEAEADTLAARLETAASDRAEICEAAKRAEFVAALGVGRAHLEVKKALSVKPSEYDIDLGDAWSDASASAIAVLAASTAVVDLWCPADGIDRRDATLICVAAALLAELVSTATLDDFDRLPHLVASARSLERTCADGFGAGL